MKGSRGARLLLSSMRAPSPFAHQWSALIPFPMNCTTKRLGKAAGALGSAAGSPQTGTDSSQGRAMTTPAPRRNMRRETARGVGASVWSGLGMLLKSCGREGALARYGTPAGFVGSSDFRAAARPRRWLSAPAARLRCWFREGNRDVLVIAKVPDSHLELCGNLPDYFVLGHGPHREPGDQAVTVGHRLVGHADACFVICQSSCRTAQNIQPRPRGRPLCLDCHQHFHRHLLWNLAAALRARHYFNSAA